MLHTGQNKVHNFGQRAVKMFGGLSVYPVAKIGCRRTKGMYDIFSGLVVARSEDHAPEYDHPLLLSTSGPTDPPGKQDLIIGQLRLHPTKKGPREYTTGHLSQWFGIDIQGQIFIELITGREKYLDEMWDMLQFPEEEPYFRYFYSLRAELLVKGNLKRFVEMVADPAVANEYGIEDPYKLIEEISDYTETPQILSDFDAALHAKGLSKTIAVAA